MKVAILGYGVEGKSAEKYFAAQNADIKIFDNFTEADIDTFDLAHFDLVVRTPSVRPRAGWTSVTKIFFEECPCPIIGVTGTKGKGTTSSLIASILRAAGKTVHLIGNIGTAALDALPSVASTDLVVYELSSFQLWDMKQSPHVAVLSHMDIDHLNIHTDKEEYWDAKKHITAYQTTEDVIIYEADNPISAQIVAGTLAQKLTYPTHQFDDIIVKNLHLPGEHNRRNAQAAILASLTTLGQNLNNIEIGSVSERGVHAPIPSPGAAPAPHKDGRARETSPNFDIIQVLRQGLSNFTGLPHRLKLIRKLKGVEYYDDSYSTMPAATIAAIKAFPDSPKILILGGSPKGADFTELAEAVRENHVKHAFLVGPEGEKIQTALDAAHYQDYTCIPEIPYDMSAVVQKATALATPGDCVILSPAAASFDSFANYSARGEAFISAVEAL